VKQKLFKPIFLYRHSDVELKVEKCKQTLHHLDDSEDQSPITNVHPTLLTQIVTQIRNSFSDLSASQIELDAVWKSVDEGCLHFSTVSSTSLCL
jgi:hypothetical protein